MKPPVVLWYQSDLRIGDHPALNAAVDTGQPIIPIYIFDDASAGDRAPGGASRWWLHHSLSALDASLKKRGNRLVLRRGETLSVLTDLLSQTGASDVFFTRRYEPWASTLQRDVFNALDEREIACRRFGGGLLFEPETIKSKQGTPFKVFTPFYKACLANGVIAPPLNTPRRIEAPDRFPDGDRLDNWRLLPKTPDWAGGLRATWSPGEDGAATRLAAFLEHAVQDYDERRDRPDLPGTSQLSPHLHFGEISPRTCWQSAKFAADHHSGGNAGHDSFLREVVWREFSYHLLQHWPSLPEEPFRPAFRRFPWREDDGYLRAWQKGQTGYPIVDAGMRQLWHRGWIHNRVRMIAASFLCKHLLLDWRVGAQWFWDTLVDADLANNSAGWQWVAGSGADAAPYFRIFNPMTQGEKFDPEGNYVRRWIPELANLPTKFIHQPWTAPADILSQAGVQLGHTYPMPIVDHMAARKRALSAYQSLKD
jgi:deoxyribodipyrimidine photo-lyase